LLTIGGLYFMDSVKVNKLMRPIRRLKNLILFVVSTIVVTVKDVLKQA